MGKKIKQRLFELKAAYSLSEISRVPPARRHELKGDLNGKLSVDIDHPYRLIFIPANDPIPRKANGGLDWAKVTEIEILGIKDTHGK